VELGKDFIHRLANIGGERCVQNAFEGIFLNTYSIGTDKRQRFFLNYFFDLLTPIDYRT